MITKKYTTEFTNDKNEIIEGIVLARFIGEATTWVNRVTAQFQKEKSAHTELLKGMQVRTTHHMELDMCEYEDILGISYISISIQPDLSSGNLRITFRVTGANVTEFAKVEFIATEDSSKKSLQEIIEYLLSDWFTEVEA